MTTATSTSYRRAAVSLRFIREKTALAVVALLMVFTLGAQPTIQSFSPESGPTGTFVTITGTGFQGTPSANTVHFGAVKATVTAATATQLTVQVPAGATFHPITVTANGLTGYSRKPFAVTYLHGESSFAATSFHGARYSKTGQAPYGQALADLDGDGWTDVAAVNFMSHTFSVLRNTSAGTSISFDPRVDIATGSGPYAVAAGDLDGDGLTDIAVVNYNDDNVSVFKNTGTPGAVSFGPKTDFATGNTPVHVAIQDLDRDGRPDLVVSNNMENTISLLRNTTTGGILSFAPKADYPVPPGPYHVGISDLDDNGKPEIVVVLELSYGVIVFSNQSTPGNFSFARGYTITTGQRPRSVAIADMDGDSKPDMAVGNYNSNNVSVLRNVTTTGEITFTPPVHLSTGSNTYPEQVAVGDLNGDGKADLAVSLFAQDNRITLFKNSSTSGTLRFETGVDCPAAYEPHKIELGDLNGDGKADIIETSLVSDEVVVLRNRIGEPAVTSFAPAIAGRGDTVTITGANFTGATEVRFGGVAAASFDVVLPNTIIAVVGNGANGDVTVTTPRGTAAAPGFVYPDVPTIASFTPTGGIKGTTVTITGTDFVHVQAVSFGGTPAATFTVVSPTSITAVVGEGTSGDVSVTTAYGTVAVPGFTHQAPALYSFTPATAGTGTTVTLTGSNFTGTTAVRFGQTMALSFSVVDDTTLTAVVGGGSSGAVSVTTPMGTTALTGFSFTLPASPVVTGFSPRSGVPGTTVILAGRGFSATAHHNIVHFGATRAVVTSASPAQLAVIVPRGTTHVPVSVVNTETGLTGYAPQPFVVTFKNPAPLQESSFERGSLWSDAYTYPIGVAISDLDGDGKPDVGMAVKSSLTSFISLHRNTSAVGAVSFADKVSVPGLAAETIALEDLDGDGRADIAGVSNSPVVSLARNTSTVGTISFAPKVDLASGGNSQKLGIGDLDGDGRPELVVSNYNTHSISVFRNTSIPGILSFDAKVDFATPGTSMDVTLTDLDSDGKLDVVVTTGYASTRVSVFRNTSPIGALSLDRIDFAFTGRPERVYSSDVNGDSRADLILTDNEARAFYVHKNTSSGNSISFASPLVFTTTERPLCGYISDVNGDGKPDFCAGISWANAGSLAVFQNTTTGDTISFAPQVNYGSGTPWSVAVADLDADTKPDIAAATPDWYLVSLFRNMINREPQRVEYCPNGSFTIASNITGESYRWQMHGGVGFNDISNDSNFNGVTTALLELRNIPPSWSGYQLRCIVGADTSRVFGVFSSAAPSPYVSISASANPVCVAMSVTFTASIANAGTEQRYQWEVNGVRAGADSTSFTYVPVQGDRVKLQLSTNATCVLSAMASSNVITMTVNPMATPSATVRLPDSVCSNSAFAVTFSSTTTPLGSQVQIWEGIDGNAFAGGASQVYSGGALSFAADSNKNASTRKFFFRIAPPSTACAKPAYSDTASVRIDHLVAPVITQNNGTLTVTNADPAAVYTWQVLQPGGTWVDRSPVVTGDSLVSSASGTYRVKAERGACIQYSAAQTVVLTAVEPVPAVSMAITGYPNPTAAVFIIDSLKISDHWQVLELYRADGMRQLARYPIQNQTRVILHCEQWEKGLYIALLSRKKGGPVILKFVKL